MRKNKSTNDSKKTMVLIINMMIYYHIIWNQ